MIIKKSVSKIKGSGKTRVPKIQDSAKQLWNKETRVMGKTSINTVYRKFINQMKKKTKNEIDEVGVGTGSKWYQKRISHKDELPQE